MSTLVAQTISNGSVSTSSANVIQGSAKAWVNFNGTTSPGTIRASYNVSSVTKNTTGDYTVNFTNAFADTNYVTTVAMHRGDGAGNNPGFANLQASSGNAYSAGVLTTSVRVTTSRADGPATDAPYCGVAIFR